MVLWNSLDSSGASTNSHSPLGPEVRDIPLLSFRRTRQGRRRSCCGTVLILQEPPQTQPHSWPGGEGVRKHRYSWVAKPMSCIVCPHYQCIVSPMFMRAPCVPSMNASRPQCLCMHRASPVLMPRVPSVYECIVRPQY